jgi:hypothetical protein
MPLNQDQRTKIQEVVKRILLSRADSFPTDSNANRNAPFHDAFLAAFREKLESTKIETPYLVAIASWMHGLNTSLGSGFEDMAHILSGGFKRSFTGNFALKVTTEHASNIESIIVALKNSSKKKGVTLPNLQREDALILQNIRPDAALQDALGFSADNYVETESAVECIELKSVRPNSGEGRGEKQKILYAKAALKLLHPSKQIRFFVGFPFDPTSKTPTDYDKERFLNHLVEFKKFFSPDEILIASEFWNHLSGQPQTMEQILEIVAETVREFVSH